MRYALLEGQRREATPGLVGECPRCQTPVLAKCGNQRVWHWAHRGTVACELKREKETEWHRGWKNYFPAECQEVTHRCLFLRYIQSNILTHGCPPVICQSTETILSRLRLPGGQPQHRTLYDDIYCARGDMENRVKEAQGDLFADRTSAHGMRANQLRLWFAAMAYVLLCALRRIALQGSALARACCATIHLRLLKIGARVSLSARRIRIAMASGFALQEIFSAAHGKLAAAIRT